MLFQDACFLGVGALKDRLSLVPDHKDKQRTNYFVLGKGNWHCVREILKLPHIIFAGLKQLLIRLEDIVVANSKVVDSLIMWCPQTSGRHVIEEDGYAVIL